MRRHPTYERLEHFVDGTGSAERRRELGEHLEACPRCRRIVDRIRALGRRARELSSPTLPPGGFREVRKRIEAGEAVLLPSGEGWTEPTGRRLPVRRLLHVAGAAAALLLGAVLLDTPYLEAHRSVLELTPASPVAGDVVRVLYRPTSSLAGRDRLLLRGRLRRPGGESYDVTGLQSVLDTLTPAGGGRFEGEFRLPVGVVYAALAVEDVEGESVDTNGGRLWRVLLHRERDGRPLFAALEAQVTDSYGRSWTQGHDAAKRMVELYPDTVRGWRRLRMFERELAPAARHDSLDRRFHRAFRRLHDLYAGRTDVSAETAAELWNFAWGLSGGRFSSSGANPDTAGSRMAFWRDRVLSDGGTGDRAMAVRSMYTLVEHLSEPERGLQAYEELWREIDDPREGGADMLIRDVGLLVRSATPDVKRRWLLRSLEVDPDADWSVGRQLAGMDDNVDEGIELLERAVERRQPADDASRPLVMPRRAYADSMTALRARVMADLAQAYLSAGRRGEASAVLDQAEAAPWNPEVLTDVASAYLELGDTTRAVEAFARVAADPLRSSAFEDTVRAAVGDLEAFGWHERVRTARPEVRAAILSSIEVRPHRRGNTTLEHAGSGRIELDDLQGRPGVVSFWSPRCGASLGELSALAPFQEELRSRGLFHLAVTEGAFSPGVEDVLAEWEASSLDVAFDVDGQLRNRFNSWITPEHVVLDALGRPVFVARGTGHLDEILRVVVLLSDDRSGDTARRKGESARW